MRVSNLLLSHLTLITAAKFLSLRENTYNLRHGFCKHGLEELIAIEWSCRSRLVWEVTVGPLVPSPPSRATYFLPDCLCVQAYLLPWPSKSKISGTNLANIACKRNETSRGLVHATTTPIGALAAVTNLLFALLSPVAAHIFVPVSQNVHGLWDKRSKHGLERIRSGSPVKHRTTKRQRVVNWSVFGWRHSCLDDVMNWCFDDVMGWYLDDVIGWSLDDNMG